MSTRMSSESEYNAESERCRNKPFLNLWVWARESQLSISASRELAQHLPLSIDLLYATVWSAEGKTRWVFSLLS